MAIVIDAQIIHGVYRVELKKKHDLSECPSTLLDRLRGLDVYFAVDAGRQIVSEWERAVDWDWFQNWFMGFVQNYRVVDIATTSCPDLIKRLRTDFGFPLSGDVWLIRTAVADSSSGKRGDTVLLSEDADFYDPPYKKDPAMRVRFLDGSVEGRLAKYLRKNHGVAVRSVVRAMPA